MHGLWDHNIEIKVVALTNVIENLKLTSSRVQKNIVSAIIFETLIVIIQDIDNSLFIYFILVDES